MERAYRFLLALLLKGTRGRVPFSFVCRRISVFYNIIDRVMTIHS